MQYAFRFNVDRCGECHACEVACKAAHDLHPRAAEKPGTMGPAFRKVVTIIEGEARAENVQYVSMACMHCETPDCMEVCPAQAIYRDPEFGAVIPNHDRCIGCHYCSWACEFGAPQFGVDGVMHKCDMCIDRLREGRKPACVEACCGGALTCEPVEMFENDVRRKAARKLAAGIAESHASTVIYR